MLAAALVAGNVVAAGNAETGSSARTPKKDVVAIVCAHPDDLAISLGFCLLARETYDIHVIDFTHGERGCGYDNFTNGWTKAKRTQEERDVCAAVGAKLHWLDEIDGEAYANRETCEKLAAIFRELKPRALIGHWPVDIHTDHVMTGAAMLRAAFLADLKCEIWFCPQHYQAKSCTPDVLLDISSVYDKVIEISRLYECQNTDDCLVKAHEPGYVWFGKQSADYYSARCEGYKAMIPPRQGQRTIFADLPHPGGDRHGFYFEGAK